MSAFPILNNMLSPLQAFFPFNDHAHRWGSDTVTLIFRWGTWDRERLGCLPRGSLVQMRPRQPRRMRCEATHSEGSWQTQALSCGCGGHISPFQENRASWFQFVNIKNMIDTDETQLQAHSQPSGHHLANSTPFSFAPVLFWWLVLSSSRSCRVLKTRTISHTAFISFWVTTVLAGSMWWCAGDRWLPQPQDPNPAQFAFLDTGAHLECQCPCLATFYLTIVL